MKLLFDQYLEYVRALWHASVKATEEPNM